MHTSASKASILPENILNYISAWRYHSTLFILLGGVLYWGAQVNNPDLLVDLAGSWEACPATENSANHCKWRAVAVPAHFVARGEDPLTSYIHYRRTFKTPPECHQQTCKLVFAEVGDSADVEINGVLLRQSVPADEQHIYRKHLPLGIDLPPEALHKGEADNQIVVRVHSFRDQQAGLRAGPLGLTYSKAGDAFLQWRTFRNVYVPLTCSIVAAIMVLLSGFLPRMGVSDTLWGSFYAYATSSALFLFSFTEIPRVLWPMSLVIPAHFFLRFYTDFALMRLILASSDYDAGLAWRMATFIYRTLLTAFAALFMTGGAALLTGSNWVTPSHTFSLVLFAYPLSVALPTLIAARALRAGHRWVGGAVCLVVAVVLHEWAIGSGFWQGEFLSKYHHLLATGGFLLLLVRKATRAQTEQAMARAAELELAQLARQVDHDIRSPLAALDMAARELSGAPENVRILVRMAVDRIRDIANSLRQRRGSENAAAALRDDTRPLLLLNLVEDVISEKRTARVAGAAGLEHCTSPAGYGLFVRGAVGTLKRVLSNLLNNGLEAAGEAGHVRVRVTRHGSVAHIVIADDGPGIPAAVLQRWGERGMTLGKAAGSGLGVHHAVHSVEALGGSLSARNLEAGGAEVTLRLPLCEAPAWFAPNVQLERGQIVVIVDDDRAVHAAWREHLRETQVAMVHVSSAAQLQKWLSQRPAGRVSYFVDYELAGDNINGLTLVCEWLRGEEAYLVTSHSETPSVVAQCEADGARIIPKSLVCMLPLTGSATVAAA